MNRWLGVALAGYVGVASGCGRADTNGTDEKDEKAAAPQQPADSLALSIGTGVEIWYTLTRPSTGADRKPCVERGLEIRRPGERIPVPLLYTGETPTLLNDSTLRAMLWTDCRPTASYLVDLRNGRPTREQERSPS